MLSSAAIVISLVFLAVTAAPLWRTGWKWIRIWDFPRLQIAVGLCVSLFLDALFLPLNQPWPLILMASLAIALGYQFWRIYPYLPIAGTQAPDSLKPDGADCVSILIANVRMENRRSEKLLDLVEDLDPDIAFFVETDSWWDETLSGLGSRYPHAIRLPMNNTFGIAFYTRLDLHAHEVRYLVDPEIPSIHAEASLPSGKRIKLHGIHPDPPPLSDTPERDAEILLVGRMTRESELPSLVFGDLNDVGWSRTTELFVTVSRLVDPRVGRGLFATFHAKYPLLRWPLDHIFIDPRFTVRKLCLGPAFGSDHLPVFGAFCLSPDTDGAAEPKPDATEKRQAEDAIRDVEGTGPPEKELPVKTETNRQAKAKAAK